MRRSPAAFSKVARLSVESGASCLDRPVKELLERSTAGGRRRRPSRLKWRRTMNPKMMKAARVFFSMALLLVALCPPALVFGQETRGTISGTVRDVSQAVIAGAPVKINNLSRGISVSITTNDAGLFRAPYLVAGTYQLIVEARGF